MADETPAIPNESGLTADHGPLTTDEPDAADVAKELAVMQSDHRLWLKQLTAFVQTRSRETDPSGRVQLALDLALVNACERIGRICRSDLPPL